MHPSRSVQHHVVLVLGGADQMVLLAEVQRARQTVPAAPRPVREDGWSEALNKDDTGRSDVKTSLSRTTTVVTLRSIKLNV